MGADNWDTCPRCADRADKEHEQSIKDHADRYGEVPAYEWVAEMQELAATRLDFTDHKWLTFREDYEWWIDDEDGVVSLMGKFRGGCTNCDLEVTHTVDRIVFYTKGEPSA